VYFGQNAPAEATDVYTDAPNATNYVTNPTATGWGTNWNGRPVVRLPLYGDMSNMTGLTVAQVSAAGGVTNAGATITVDGTPHSVSNGANIAITSGSGVTNPAYFGETDLATSSAGAFTLNWNAYTNAYDWTVSAASTCTVGAAVSGKDRWASLRILNSATSAITWSGINVWVTNGVRGATAPAAAADSMILINWRGTGVWAHAASTSATVGAY